MNRQITLACVAILAAGVAAVAVIYLWPPPTLPPPDPATLQPEQITKYLASAEFNKLDDAEKDAYYGKVASRFENTRDFRMRPTDLTDAERARLRQNIGPLFEKAQEQRVDKFFELSREERVAHLDKMIDQMQAMREAAEERRRQQPEGETTRPGRGFRFRPPADGTAPARGGPPFDTSPPPGAGPPPDGGPPPNEGPPPFDAGRDRNPRPTTGPATGAADRPRLDRAQREAVRLDRMRERIETTPPENRAKMAEFRRQLQKRMQERGVTQGPFRGGGGGPPGRRN